MEHIEEHNWSYNEFLAFVLVFGAQMSLTLTPEELEFIRERSKITDITKIKAKVDSINDANGIEVIEHYRKKYLTTPEAREKAKRDLEALLATDGKHSPLEKAAVHIIEKLL